MIPLGYFGKCVNYKENANSWSYLVCSPLFYDCHNIFIYFSVLFFFNCENLQSKKYPYTIFKKYNKTVIL